MVTTGRVAGDGLGRFIDVMQTNFSVLSGRITFADLGLVPIHEIRRVVSREPLDGS